MNEIEEKAVRAVAKELGVSLKQAAMIFVMGRAANGLDVVQLATALDTTKPAVCKMASRLVRERLAIYEGKSKDDEPIYSLLRRASECAMVSRMKATIACNRGWISHDMYPPLDDKPVLVVIENRMEDYYEVRIGRWVSTGKTMPAHEWQVTPELEAFDFVAAWQDLPQLPPQAINSNSKEE